jgi:hypothetical protein
MLSCTYIRSIFFRFAPGVFAETKSDAFKAVDKKTRAGFSAIVLAGYAGKLKVFY